MLPSCKTSRNDTLPHATVHNATHRGAASIDVARLRVEQDRVIHERHDEFDRLGVGVTPAAQVTFDTLEKTLPCKWDRDTIVILESVRLRPPYDVNSIRYVFFFPFLFIVPLSIAFFSPLRQHASLFIGARAHARVEDRREARRLRALRGAAASTACGLVARPLRSRTPSRS